MNAVHANPCAHPRNSADSVTTVNPPAATDIIPKIGAHSATLHPAMVTRRASPRVRHRAHDEIAALRQRERHQKRHLGRCRRLRELSPALSRDASLCNCSAPPRSAVSAHATTSCALVVRSVGDDSAETSSAPRMTTRRREVEPPSPTLARSARAAFARVSESPRARRCSAVASRASPLRRARDSTSTGDERGRGERGNDA